MKLLIWTYRMYKATHCGHKPLVVTTYFDVARSDGQVASRTSAQLSFWNYFSAITGRLDRTSQCLLGYHQPHFDPSATGWVPTCSQVIHKPKKIIKYPTIIGKVQGWRTTQRSSVWWGLPDQCIALAWLHSGLGERKSGEGLLKVSYSRGAMVK